MPDAPAGYHRNVQRWIKISSNKDGFEVFDPRNPGDRKPLEIGTDIKAYIGELPSDTKSKTQIMSNYTVSVSGKIRYYNNIEQLNRGIYGNGVALWFRNSSAPAHGIIRLQDMYSISTMILLMSRVIFLLILASQVI